MPTSRVPLMVVPKRSAGHPHGRVFDAALSCIARWGLSKTTLEDIAREAGCSRATVYRVFPGGKETLLEALANDELTRFFEGLGQCLDAAGDIVTMLEDGILYVSRALASNDALQYLLKNEPDQVMPMAVGRGEQSLTAATAFLVPYLSKHVGPERAGADAELVARLVFSYNLSPSLHFDFTDPKDVRDFVAAYVLPSFKSV